MFIVNAPALFSGIWAIFKGFIDEQTRKKITILGGNFKAQLLQAVEPENLPDFFGGTCTCADYEGGCLMSKAGPW